jgi:putative DNA methylase
VAAIPGSSALEASFPSEKLHPLAELESWRKEVNRPIYHVHKWWANRLGSIFRAIVLAGNLGSEEDVWANFYLPHNFRDTVVLDPFMGSGTTIGEALKLGCRAIGCDINPVAYFQVKKALEYCDERKLRDAYARLERDAAPLIRSYYRSTYHGEDADLLYTFWVKVLPCPCCTTQTRLFSRWIFSAHAYPNRNPESQAVCPACGEVNQVPYTAEWVVCSDCAGAFNPQHGPAKGQTFTCEGCGAEHRILDSVRSLGRVPEHRMYALMLLLPDGRKVYKRPDAADHALYAEAEAAYSSQVLPIPRVAIPQGHNTNQARGYNYRFWHEMFNARQLFALGTLLGKILEEPDRNARECLLLLFSGMLEFNNMFCSFKGEGTGAVRHLFSHHILKPERTPLEANPWGTERSSGAFSQMFERRLMAGKRYAANPFELRVTAEVGQNGRATGEKVHGVNRPLRPVLAERFEQIASGESDVLLCSGDSAALPIPDGVVDLVITDPPYFDNVHYSELADFFYCWLQQGLVGDPAFARPTTRSKREVQSTDDTEFCQLLSGVFTECRRVMKPDGLLAFTFHHSRDEAWVAVANAVRSAGLVVVAAHPVKAEMAVAVPKMQAKEPINLDLIIVCRPVCPSIAAARDLHGMGDQQDTPDRPSTGRVAFIVEESARRTIARYNRAGIKLSKGDVRVILMGGYLKAQSAEEGCAARTATDTLLASITVHIDALHANQNVSVPEHTAAPISRQLKLFEKNTARQCYEETTKVGDQKIAASIVS